MRWILANRPSCSSLSSIPQLSDEHPRVLLHLLRQFGESYRRFPILRKLLFPTKAGTLTLPAPIPKLCTLVTASPFDAAIHDAFGKLHGRNCYRTYGPDLMPTTLEQLSTTLADRYRVEREVGQGGMATVYLALQESVQREVALKGTVAVLFGFARRPGQDYLDPESDFLAAMEIVERDLPVKHLPEPLAESRLVQLSDLHIGFRVNDDVRPEVTLFRLTSRPSPSGPAATDTV